MIELIKLNYETTQEAYDNGFNRGEHLGFENGKEKGYMDGWEDGEEAGYTDGYEDGESVGYNTGYQKGKDYGYNQGKSAGINEQEKTFWDAYMKPDEETGLIYGSYLFAGCGITQDMLERCYYHKGTQAYSNAYSMFRSNANIGNLRGFRFNLSECTDTDYMFSSCENLRYIYSFRFPNLETHAYRTFRRCHSLKIIDKCYFSENTTAYEEVFLECYSLTNINPKGVINGTGLHFEDCPLTVDCMVEIIGCLKKQPTGSTKVITFGEANIAKLTEAQIAEALEKGWTIH
jgi:hypothetical protein